MMSQTATPAKMLCEFVPVLLSTFHALTIRTISPKMATSGHTISPSRCVIHERLAARSASSRAASPGSARLNVSTLWA